MGLDSVELVLATEKEIGIAIDDADAANLTTPRLLADYVFSRRGVESFSRQPRREDWSHDDVLRRIIQITSIQLAIPIEKIHPDHHFVKDLGVD